MNRRRPHPRLPLRRWLLIALISLWFVPVVTMGVIAFHVLGVGPPASSNATELLRDNAAKWSDPTWQAATRAKLAADDTNFVLVENGQEIYRSTPDPLVGTDGGKNTLNVDEIVVPGTPARIAYLYAPANHPWQQHNRLWLVPISGGLALLLTIVTIGWRLGRTVVRPLGATSNAAERIATGDLDIELPRSSVREVDEVNRAFTDMSHALRDSLQQQARLEQERRLFIGAIVHDLRTPLFSLRGYLEGLAKGVADTPDKRVRYLAVAQEKADTLERLIDDLFSYTRLEYLDQAPKPEPLDLGKLLQRLTVGLEPQAAAKDVSVAFQPPTEPCVVNADRHLLTRAIENLADNAIRYTPGGGRIVLACRATEGHAIFTVSDTGPGIPTQDLPHLFTPMYRGETSRNRRTGGAGLGLSVARRILRAHGGDLTGGNRPEGGAVFTGTLPAAPVAQPQPQPDQPREVPVAP